MTTTPTLVDVLGIGVLSATTVDIVMINMYNMNF